MGNILLINLFTEQVFYLRAPIIKVSISRNNKTADFIRQRELNNMDIKCVRVLYRRNGMFELRHQRAAASHNS